MEMLTKSNFYTPQNYFSSKTLLCFFLNTAQKTKLSIKDFFSKCDQIRTTADLVTFTEEILNGKLHFLCSENCTDGSYTFNKERSLLNSSKEL